MEEQQMWSYARLVSKAKKSGGPEKYVDELVEWGAKMERRQMQKEIILIGSGYALLGAIVGVGAMKLWEYHKNKRKEEEKKIAVTKQKLIAEINAYDEAHPEE